MHVCITVWIWLVCILLNVIALVAESCKGAPPTDVWCELLYICDTNGKILFIGTTKLSFDSVVDLSLISAMKVWSYAWIMQECNSDQYKFYSEVVVMSCQSFYVEIFFDWHLKAVSTILKQLDNGIYFI